MRIGHPEGISLHVDLHDVARIVIGPENSVYNAGSRRIYLIDKLGEEACITVFGVAGSKSIPVRVMTSEDEEDAA